MLDKVIYVGSYKKEFNTILGINIIMYPIGWTNLKVHSLKSDR